MKLLSLKHSTRSAIVDDEDYARLSEHEWSWTGTRIRRCYVHSSYVTLASEIMHQPKIMFDHINRNPLDNRKQNLRQCSYSQNSMNVVKREGNFSSKYKGVSFIKISKKWRATIKVNKRFIHLGCFKNEEEAARAYDDAAINLFKEFANINFK